MGADYRGAYSSDAEALPHLRAEGDVYFNTHSHVLRQGTNFVMGSGGDPIYTFVRLVRVDDESTDEPLVYPPHVGRLPDATDDTTPDVVYLSEEYSTGVKESITVTIGSMGGIVGLRWTPALARPSAACPPESPLLRIFGVALPNGDRVFDVVSAYSKRHIEDIIKYGAGRGGV